MHEHFLLKKARLRDDENSPGRAKQCDCSDDGKAPAHHTQRKKEGIVKKLIILSQRYGCRRWIGDEMD
jgi:hypothetical protein